jgi:amino acid permease
MSAQLDPEIEVTRHRSSSRDRLLDDSNSLPSYVNGATIIPPNAEHLQRGLSARQVQMIALAGTIGTGLFLGTGKSLAEGGFTFI